MEPVEQTFVDERAGIDDDIRLFQLPFPADGDEIRRAGSGSDKCD